MISSGTVSQQAKTVTSAIKSCNDSITGLSGSWEGSSYDNLVSKVGEFASSYKSTIETQMTAFGEACDLYKEYEAEKKLLEQYKEDLAAEERAYNRAKSKGGVNVYLGGYIRDIRSLERSIASSEEKMKELKKQIEEKLSSISDKLDKGSTPQKVSVNGMVADIEMSEFTKSGKFTTAEINGQKGMYLTYDEHAINDIIGAQTGSDCGIYATAYGYVVLEGGARVPEGASVSQIREAYNDGDTSDNARWPGCKYHDGEGITSTERMNAIWEEVHEKNKPVIAAVQGSSYNHYVTVVGFKEGATKENLQPSDLIVLDSARGQRMHYYGEGFTEGKDFNGSNYGLDYVTFPDDENEK